MKRPIRRLLRPLFPSVAVFVKALGLMYSRRSALRQLGYLESAKSKRPCRRDGSPIPWMNYQVIGFLVERLTSDSSVFEYGNGNLTRFFAALVEHVTSLEMDTTWYEQFQSQVPANVLLLHYEETGDRRYCEVLREQKRKFDVVVIDAIDRVDCMLEAVSSLSDLDFEGLKPISIQAYRTTIFYRAANCFGL